MKEINKIVSKFFSFIMIFVIVVVTCPLLVKADGPVVAGVEIRTFAPTNLYVGSKGDEVAIIVPEDTRMVVRKEVDGRFLVDYGGMQAWIGTGDCLVNIKDYIPTLEICLDMATGSIFTMGGQEIDGLYGEVLYHYGGAASGEEAWLKYGPAKKLYACQEELLAQGYGFVIYDAYRPYSVTVFIRDAFKSFLNTRSANFKKQFFKNLGEGWFLAPGVSSHNWGVAVDLTIRSMSTGEEIPMPTDMHTLDYRSALEYWEKNTNARAKNGLWLKDVMTRHGFSSLKSEWWHFQDNTEPRIQMDVPN